MSLKKRWLEKSYLYVIADKKISAKLSILDIVNKIKHQGINIIQYRDKESRKEAILSNAFCLKKLLADTKILFIINDYLDVAKIVDSDGIHLGQDDIPIEIARKALGKDKIIGISCHSVEQAKEAEKRGADYIGLGPIFPTSQKPEYKPVGLDLIKEIKAKIKIPFFVIGDINQHNIDEVISAGARRVAICRAIIKAEDISLAARKFSKILKRCPLN